jgi:RNA processing factor Prp31
LIDGTQEWYGWHFPEMAKIITDNLAYANVVRAMGQFNLSTLFPLLT